MSDYTNPAKWPSRDKGEPHRAYMARVCTWQTEQRRIHNPELAAEVDRIEAAFNGPASEHPLTDLLLKMAASGRALIIHEGEVLAEPLVEVERLSATRIAA